MKATTLLTLFASVFLGLLVLSSASVSATTLTFNPASAQLSLGTNSTIVQLTTNNATGVNITSLDFSTNPIIIQGVSITLAKNVNAPFTIISGSPRDITLSIQSVSGQLPFGTYQTSLNAVGTDGTTQVNASLPVTYVQSFCRTGARGTNLSIGSVDISSSGDEDEEWKLLDRIDVEVEVENNGDNDIDDVQVEIGLFDSDGRNVVGDLDFTNADEEQIDVGNINDDSDETVNFEFMVPADFDTGNYKLAVKVYSDDLGESNLCDDSSNDLGNDLYQEISVDNEDEEEKFVVVDDIRFPTEATCGETITGTFRVFNIGDEDQDQVLITMKNAELGLNREFEIREDLDKGDDDLLDFAFDVPATARDGTYSIAFKTFYDYDDNDDSYDQESEDEFISTLRVIGCSNQPPVQDADVAINAELDSDAVAGQTLKVIVTLRNEGAEEVSVSLDVDGYDNWAELDSISDRSFTLDAGDEEEITLVFTVNDDVSGTESFVLLSTIDGQRESQEVEVEFAEDNGGNGFQLPQGSGILWIIGIINVVLIVLIIIVAIRLSRR